MVRNRDGGWEILVCNKHPGAYGNIDLGSQVQEKVISSSRQAHKSKQGRKMEESIHHSKTIHQSVKKKETFFFPCNDQKETGDLHELKKKTHNRSHRSRKISQTTLAGELDWAPLDFKEKENRHKTPLANADQASSFPHGLHYHNPAATICKTNRIPTNLQWLWQLLEARKKGGKEASQQASKIGREKAWSGQPRNENLCQVAQATANDKLTICRRREEKNQLREPQPRFLNKEKLVEVELQVQVRKHMGGDEVS